MRAISPPQIGFSDVLTSCVGSIADQNLVNKINAVTPQLNLTASDFEVKVARADLFQLPAFTGDDSSIIVGQVTKGELKSLYSSHMVPAKKPARSYYDQLKMSAPLNICPYCGFGHVTTLDHYLAKANYPCFSVLAINLVPSCADCNKGKSSSLATTKGNQSLHPYFDHGHFVNEQWLYAEVEQQSSPPSIKFSAIPPTHWQDIDKERVKSHFKDFKLAARFKVQAATELAVLKGELEFYFQEQQAAGVAEALSRKHAAARGQHINWWKTALFHALAHDAWYCSVGFR
ncbi:hypothetical protein ACO1PK_00990 [Alishewanella sp. d11]|uniref:hypothetical protein n=1 Tax=Alishewanella sp. d11 TaxID=3414030 RepID=UPI003BF77D8D